MNVTLRSSMTVIFGITLRRSISCLFRLYLVNCNLALSNSVLLLSGTYQGMTPYEGALLMFRTNHPLLGNRIPEEMVRALMNALYFGYSHTDGRQLKREWFNF